MQDILKNYYANGGKTLFESEELEEGVIVNTALLVAALTSMLAQVPDVNPAKSQVQTVAQELLQKELQNPQVTPAVINSSTGIGLAFGVNASDLSDISKITNNVTYKSATSSSHTYAVSENLMISVTRVSKEFVEMPNYYNTTCLIDALYTLNGVSQAATEMVEFNHRHMGDWADMKSCDVPSLVKIVKDKMSNKEFIAVPNNTL